MTLQLSIVVAMDRNRVIGLGNKLPWHIPEDLRHFKLLTFGKPIVMGRKTFESIGKPLPGRTNIIITRQKDYEVPGVIVVNSIEDAYRACEVEGAEENFIIGGEEIFRQAIGDCQKIYLTEIHGDFDGDTFFPEFDNGDFYPRKIGRNQYSADDIGFNFSTYARYP